MMIFDAHFHIIDPNFPLTSNQGFLPKTFTVDDYLKCVSTLNVQGGAIISGSFQGFDQNYLMAALNQLGRNFVGVTQLPTSTSNDKIKELHYHGVRALRFNLFRHQLENISDQIDFAIRVYEMVGWHTELYVDSSDLGPLKKMILRLPKVSIDHLGLNKSGFSELLKLVEKGVKVKASGFMRVNFNVKEALIKIYQINSQALMFGTDLPGTRASRQFSLDDLMLIKNNFSDDEIKKILWNNAKNFYFND